MAHAGHLKSGERRYMSEYLSYIRKDMPIGQKRGYPKNCISFFDWKKEKGYLDAPRIIIY